MPCVFTGANVNIDDSEVLDRIDVKKGEGNEEVSDLDEDDSVTNSGNVSIGDEPKDDVNDEQAARISTKEKLKNIAQEERRQVNELTKSMRKEASKNANTVPKNNGSSTVTKNNSNDEEKQEDKDKEEFVWEIEACPNLETEECPPTKVYKKNFKAYLKRIRNARKCKGWKMELLVEFNTGERQWSMFHGPLIDLEIPTAKFMKDCGLTLSICGYKLDPKKMTKKKREKLISYDDFNHHNRTNYNIIRDLIHQKLQSNAYDADDDDEEMSDDEKTINEETDEKSIREETNNIEDKLEETIIMTAEVETTTENETTTIETAVLENIECVTTVETTNESVTIEVETTNENETIKDKTDATPQYHSGNLLTLLDVAASAADMVFATINENDKSIEICNGKETISEHEPIDDDEMTTVKETMIAF